jgi:hypothetical protein
VKTCGGTLIDDQACCVTVAQVKVLGHADEVLDAARDL